MTRVRRDIMCREPKVYAEDDEDKLRPLDKRPRPTFLKKHRLVPFSKIGLEGTGLFSGVFITGKTPVWLMMAGHGGLGAQLEIVDKTAASLLHLKPAFEHLGKRKLQQHPMPSDGPITAFAPIHNVSIRHGFVYMTEGGNLRICQLPAQFDYGSDWPTCKISLGKTPMRVASHYASRTYVVATCSPVPFQLSRAQYTSAIAAEVIKDGEQIPESEVRTYGLKDTQRDEGMYWPETAAYKLELVSPVTWETVDRYCFAFHFRVMLSHGDDSLVSICKRLSTSRLFKSLSLRARKLRLDLNCILLLEPPSCGVKT